MNKEQLITSYKAHLSYLTMETAMAKANLDYQTSLKNLGLDNSVPNAKVTLNSRKKAKLEFKRKFTPAKIIRVNEYIKKYREAVNAEQSGELSYSEEQFAIDVQANMLEKIADLFTDEELQVIVDIFSVSGEELNNYLFYDLDI